MPDSPLVAAGAQIAPTSAAPLHTNEFFTGMWTQSNPLGPGAVPFMYHHGYGLSRFDRLVGGANCEITTRLTLARRPGSSIYNSSLFPPINRFYSWRGFSANGESIRIMASVDPDLGSAQGTVRDVTGPDTNTVLWTKARNAGRTSFVSVGNILYWGDGVDCKLLVQSNASWGAGPSAVVGTITGTQAVRVSVSAFGGFHIFQTILICTLAATAPVLVENQEIAFAGVTNAALLNGQQYLYKAITQTYAEDGLGHALAANQIAFNISNLPSYNLGFPFQSDTGTISTAGANFNTGDFIIDSNGNIQEAVGAQTATITNIQIDAYTPGRLVTLFFDPNTPITISNGVILTLAGLTTRPVLNGPWGVSAESPIQVQFFSASFGVPVTAFSAETGTATTGTGVSGPTEPVWNTAFGGITQDGGQQWVNKGSAVQDWGIAAPPNPPRVTQVVAPSLYPSWLATTWYSPTAFVIVDSNGNLQQLVGGGVTGGAHPTWATTPVGAITPDNTASWKLLGPAAWQASHAYAVGDVIQNTYTYYITVMDPPTAPPWNPIPRQIAITVTNAFHCITAGTSGTNAPSWPNGIGTTVTESGSALTWQNIGTAPAWPGAAQNLSLATKILDSNGNVQAPQLTAKTGNAAPTWLTNVGESTPETAPGTEVWSLIQNFAPAATDLVQYAYSGKSSVTGHIGPPSPMSDPITVTAGNQAVIQGDSVPNPPSDIIVLWRTLQGGSTLFYKDEFPNPYPATWIYTDTDISNNGVNQFIPAPIAGQAAPPPIGFVPHAYYLGRVFGYVGNILRWSAGPDVLPGQGSADQSFPSKNNFILPSLGVTCWATSIGLICYTLSDIWVLLGQGTANSPFYMVNFQEGVGLASKDALTVNGSTAYGMLTSGQVVSMDPGAGELEIGFPIGDLFNQTFIPSQAYCAWHLGSSADMALYVADGITSWFRMAAVAAPESGNVWSPRAIPRTAIKAIASVETTPGVRVLLLGPAGHHSPILRRDPSTNADNGETFAAYADIAPVVLAQPGTTVGVQYLVTEETRIAGASAITASIIFDEITSADFLPLRNKSPEPPLLEPSKTVNAQRHWAAQDANTVQVCRYIQQRLSWPAEDYPNELLTNTIYGRVPEKARK